MWCKVLPQSVVTLFLMVMLLQYKNKIKGYFHLRMSTTKQQKWLILLPINPWVYLLNILFDEIRCIGSKELPRHTKIRWLSWENTCMQFFKLQSGRAGFVSFLLERHLFPWKRDWQLWYWDLGIWRTFSCKWITCHYKVNKWQYLLLMIKLELSEKSYNFGKPLSPWAWQFPNP